MIQSFGFKESKESKVLIKDFDYEIVEAAIKYCYGFSIIDSLNISVGIKLLQFSDKYFIDDLKNSMEYYLLNQISPTNVSEISNASIISNSKKLHEKCLDFMYICKNV